MRLPGWVHRRVDAVGRRRSSALVDRFERFVEPGESVLDIGPGGGWISGELQRRRQTTPTLVDVTDFGLTELPVALYDGHTLPYDDNAFDLSLLVYTLHHCSEPIRVLREAVRVTRRRLIIIEDTPHSRLSKLNLVFWDVLSNAPTLVVPPGMNMPLNFRSRPSWRGVFAELGLGLVHEESFVRKRLVHKALFVLDKP